MADGTPLEALETGEVEHTADAGRMSEILRDMNASGAEVVGGGERPMGGVAQPMPPMQPMMPPMYHPQQMMHQPPPQNHYIPVDDAPSRSRKRNIWSSALESVRDPMFVMVIMFVLSLPVLHTFMAKYAHWAFAVGGQLSWFGLIALSVAGGIIFGLLQSGSNMMGL